MIFFILVALATLPIYLIISTYLAYRQNIRLAQDLGLPYIAIPISMNNLLWQLTHSLWFPIISLLPHSWTESWIEFVTYSNRDDFWWYGRYHLFEKLGDNFLLVSPGEFRLYTASAEVISQVCSRRSDFPKPTAVYENISIFGQNVVSAEGHDWRRHRKVTSPSFTEKANAMVFLESLHQVQTMLRIREAQPGSSSSNIRIDNLSMDSNRIAMHVISKAGFGIELAWPGQHHGQHHPQGKEKAQASLDEIPPGYSFSFYDSSSLFLRNITVVAIFGKNLLKYIRYIPYKLFQETSLAVQDWERYMKVHFEHKRKEILSFEKSSGNIVDVMGNLIKGAGIDLDLPFEAKKSTQLITNDEILSNAFIMLMAGHETTSNSLGFTAIMLAIDQKVQEQIQHELDALFCGRKSEEWNYDTDIPALQRTMLTAVILEQMRLYQPFCVIPKMVTHEGPRNITIDGRQIDLPAKMRVGLSAVGVHRNPKYWPHSASKVDTRRSSDLEDFVPQRWIIDDNSTSENSRSQNPTVKDVDEDVGGPKAGDKLSDSSNKHFQPPRGAYIPFSEGQRACIGRRFAMVEVYAVFSYILSEHTIELDVGEWATEEEVSRMSEEERKLVYQKATDRARDILDNTLKCGVTLQMALEKNIPLRVVKRGGGRFIF